MKFARARLQRKPYSGVDKRGIILREWLRKFHKFGKLKHLWEACVTLHKIFTASFTHKQNLPSAPCIYVYILFCLWFIKNNAFWWKSLQEMRSIKVQRMLSLFLHKCYSCGLKNYIWHLIFQVSRWKNSNCKIGKKQLAKINF